MVARCMGVFVNDVVVHGVNATKERLAMAVFLLGRVNGNRRI